MTRIKTVEELEEQLSRPTAADVSAIAGLDGDLMILGAGGKMGPSLAFLARRAADQAGVRRRIVAVSRFTDENLRRRFSAQNIETIACDLLERRDFAFGPIFVNAEVFRLEAADMSAGFVCDQGWDKNQFRTRAELHLGSSCFFFILVLGKCADSAR